MRKRRDGDRAEERGGRETVRLAEISNHASLYMGHRQWKIRWCCEMELLSFNPSNVPRDTHQITTEASVHSHTDRTADPHGPPSFTPLLLEEERGEEESAETMEMWMRALAVLSPIVFR